MTSESRPPSRAESEGYYSWPTADNEIEQCVMISTKQNLDAIDGGDKSYTTPILVNTGESSQRYLAAKGLDDVMAIRKVANPDDRPGGVLFRKEVHLLGEDLTAVVLRNELHNPNYVVGVKTIKDTQKLHFLEVTTPPSNTQLWKRGFKNGMSNAYFSLYLTEDQAGNGVRYYALPDKDKTTMILRSSDTLNTESTEVCIFSWPKFTPNEEDSKPMELFAAIQPTSPTLDTSEDCTKKNHKVHIEVERNDKDQYMVVNDHGHITTKTKDDQFDDTNVLFIWKNLQRKDGCYITLVSNNRQVGVDSIEDGEILKCGNNSHHQIKVEYFENRANSEHFALSFTSPDSGQSYYILPSSNEEPMKIHSSPIGDVYIFKIGDIDCISKEGACVFERLMRTTQPIQHDV